MTATAIKSTPRHVFPRSTAPLPREEEYALIRRWQQFGDNDARGQIVQANVRFVFQQALPYRTTAEQFGVEFEELVQEGVCALLVACDRFDDSKGFKFITYAVNWIRQHIREFLYRNYLPARAPASVRALVGAYFTARRRHPHDTHDEIVARLKLSLQQKHSLEQALQPIIQIDAPPEDGERWDHESSTLARHLSAGSPYENYEDEQMESWTHDTVQGILNQALSHYELGVVKMYFGLWNHPPMTLEEIGKLFNVTRERIRQIKARALDKLGADAQLARVFAQLN